MMHEDALRVFFVRGLLQGHGRSTLGFKREFILWAAAKGGARGSCPHGAYTRLYRVGLGFGVVATRLGHSILDVSGRSRREISAE